MTDKSSASDSSSSDRIELPGLFSSDFNVWVVLKSLYKTDHEHDYLIRRLYESDPDDLDFFLPQFIALLMSWDGADAKLLERFMLDMCAKSLHWALKMAWYLGAMGDHCLDPSVAKRCEKLSCDCELVAVNGKVSRIDTSKRSSDKEISEADQLITQNGIPGVRLDKASEIRPDPDSKSQSPPGIQPDSNIQSDKESGRPLRISPVEREMYLKKERRCEYYTAEMDMLNVFEQISDRLVKLPREHRTAQLREFLSHVSAHLPRGLYIPDAHRASTPHYSILRIESDDCVALSSRDKAPFMFEVEIEHSGLPSNSLDIAESLNFEAAESFTELASNIEDAVSPNHAAPPPRMPSTSSHRNQSAKTQSAPLTPIAFGTHARASSTQSLHCWRAGSDGMDFFGEPFEEKKKRLREASPDGSNQNWNLASYIFKGGDDLRQEHLAMQLILVFDSIWQNAKLSLHLRPYDVLVTSPTGGVIETVPNSHSIDSIKKKHSGFSTLDDFFVDTWGPRGSQSFGTAQLHFVESLAAYSLLTYFLQVKDRHNGNILLDHDGYIIHIDFGFFLSNSPGGNMNFESAPFKLTAEYIEVMDGEEDSEAFDLFTVSMIRGFLEARKHWDKVALIAEIMLSSAKMSCFSTGQLAIDELVSRFHIEKNEEECMEFVHSLIEESANNWRTVQYDNYQRITNGIL